MHKSVKTPAQHGHSRQRSLSTRAGSFSRLLIFCLVCWSSLAFSRGHQTLTLTRGENAVRVLQQSAQALILQIAIAEIELSQMATDSGAFVRLRAPGLGYSHAIGEPQLPQVSELIALPLGAEPSAELQSIAEVEVSLADYGLALPLFPAQPSLPKSVDPRRAPLAFDRSLYDRDELYGIQGVTIEVVGVMRGLPLAKVTVAPVQYSCRSHSLSIVTEAVVTINFGNADWRRTQTSHSRLRSPFWEPLYSSIRNYNTMLFAPDDDLVCYPVKMIVISDRMFETVLSPYLSWKTRKGFELITAYTDEIGASAEEIKTFIETAFEAGSPESPAPSFVLLVGDTPQIPAWPVEFGISDKPYVEFTDDDFPEIYIGRFSARLPSELQRQIDKTLAYEQYDLFGTEYLGDAIMVAGVDDECAELWLNGQINYAVNHYINADHGINDYTWLYPASANPAASQEIINTTNSGVGFVNYTGHCRHDRFTDPAFTVIDVINLDSNFKYALLIANCCLSNTFGEDTPCIGEAWMSAVNKGAIGYIGATAGTHWDEDYWWAVGAGPILAGGPSYPESGAGAYDGIFHEHGEPVAQHYVTNYAIIMAGNLAVTEASTPDLVSYYWDIYNLLGDPSVMTYFGIPTPNQVTYDQTLPLTSASLAVDAAPGSYVGISSNGVLHGAGYVDSSGTVAIQLTDLDSAGALDLVVTAQNRQPYFGTVDLVEPTDAYIICGDYVIDDSGANGDGVLDYGESVAVDVTLVNVGPAAASAVLAILSSADEQVNLLDSVAFFGEIAADFDSASVAGAFAFSAVADIDDGHTITFQLAISDTISGGAWSGSFRVPVSAPAFTAAATDFDELSGDGDGEVDPAEEATLVVTVSNIGGSWADSLSGVLAIADSSVSVLDSLARFSPTQPGDSCANWETPFRMIVDSLCSPGHYLECSLRLASDSGHSSTIVFYVQVASESNVAPQLIVPDSVLWPTNAYCSFKPGIADPDDSTHLIYYRDHPEWLSVASDSLVGFACDSNLTFVIEVAVYDDSDSAVATLPGDVYLCGDPNRDDIVNVSDAVQLIGIIFGGQALPRLTIPADVDCNSIMNISDVVYLINFIFGGGPEPCSGC